MNPPPNKKINAGRLVLAFLLISVSLLLILDFIVKLCKCISEHWYIFYYEVAHVMLTSNEFIPDYLPEHSLNGFPAILFLVAPILVPVFVFAFCIICLGMKKKHSILVSFIVLFIFTIVISVAAIDYYCNYKTGVINAYYVNSLSWYQENDSGHVESIIISAKEAGAIS